MNRLRRRLCLLAACAVVAVNCTDISDLSDSSKRFITGGSGRTGGESDETSPPTPAAPDALEVSTSPDPYNAAARVSGRDTLYVSGKEAVQLYAHIYDEKGTAAVMSADDCERVQWWYAELDLVRPITGCSHAAYTGVTSEITVQVPKVLGPMTDALTRNCAGGISNDGGMAKTNCLPEMLFKRFYLVSTDGGKGGTEPPVEPCVEPNCGKKDTVVVRPPEIIGPCPAVCAFAYNVKGGGKIRAESDRGATAPDRRGGVSAEIRLDATDTAITSYSIDGTTVTAIPDSGFRFVSWSDGNTNPTRTDVGCGSMCSPVIAYFEAIDYGFMLCPDVCAYVYKVDAGGTLRAETVRNATVPGIRPPDDGHLDITDGAITSYSTTGTPPITAVPDPGFEFVKWSDGNTNPTRTDTGCGSMCSPFVAHFAPVRSAQQTVTPSGDGAKR